jgi:hypothetical protein
VDEVTSRTHTSGEWWYDGCRQCYCEGAHEYCSLIRCPQYDPAKCAISDWVLERGIYILNTIKTMLCVDECCAHCRLATESSSDTKLNSWNVKTASRRPAPTLCYDEKVNRYPYPPLSSIPFNTDTTWTVKRGFSVVVPSAHVVLVISCAVHDIVHLHCVLDHCYRGVIHRNVVQG